MREFYEKAKKEPEKYEKLLIKRLDDLEDSSRHTFNWIIALLNIELAYVVFCGREHYIPRFSTYHCSSH